MEFNSEDFEIIDFTYSSTEVKEAYYAHNRGFYLWQFHGVIKHKTSNTSVMFSDTPSGCGPVQIYNYASSIAALLNVIPYAKYLATNRLPPFSSGATAFTFIQGVSDKKLFVKKAISELGAKVTLYSNSRHAHTDIQGFFYIDLTTSEEKDSYYKKNRIGTIKKLKKQFEDLDVEILE